MGPFLRLDAKQFERAKPYPPLATLQVAAALRESGHEVALFDAMLAENIAEYEHKLAGARAQVVVLYEDNYNFLTKMCLAAMREACCEMIAVAKRHGARVIVAGSDVSDAPEAYLRAGAEIALMGEGLDTLAALIRRLDANVEVDGVERPWPAGLAQLQQASWHEPAHVQVVAQPELPAWDRSTSSATAPCGPRRMASSVSTWPPRGFRFAATGAQSRSGAISTLSAVLNPSLQSSLI
jgi:anaerobic magnesium-protoporphyrin IX monomethyl ester cyclase